MNTNAKLIQSAVGLLLGLWVLACGGPDFKTAKGKASGFKKPAVSLSSNRKLNSEIASTSLLWAKNECVPADSRLAYKKKKEKLDRDDWFIESYK